MAAGLDGFPGLRQQSERSTNSNKPASPIWLYLLCLFVFVFSSNKIDTHKC